MKDSQPVSLEDVTFDLNLKGQPSIFQLWEGFPGTGNSIYKGMFGKQQIIKYGWIINYVWGSYQELEIYTDSNKPSESKELDM